MQGVRAVGIETGSVCREFGMDEKRRVQGVRAVYRMHAVHKVHERARRVLCALHAFFALHALPELCASHPFQMLYTVIQSLFLLH